MSIPKEKLIIFKIREIVSKPIVNEDVYDLLNQIKAIVDGYEDLGYIVGPSKVWKYEIPVNPSMPVNEEFEIEMPIGSKILTVQFQGDPCKPVMWVEVDELAATEKRKFWLVTTDFLLPEDMEYVATLQFQRGEFVVHLFAVVGNDDQAPMEYYENGGK
jgi:hypothetical protein